MARLKNVLLGTSCALLAGLTISAQATHFSANNFNGPYLGAALGFMGNDDKYRITDPANDITLYGAERRLNTQFFAGYGHAINRWYLGGEFFARTNIDKNKHQMTASNATLDNPKNEYSYGLTIKAGYAITPRFLLFALLGAQRADYKITSLTLSGSTPINFTHYYNGFMPGLGAEALLTPALALRMQYTYTLYARYTNTQSGFTTRLRPKNPLFLLGLDFYPGKQKFDGQTQATMKSGQYAGGGITAVGSDDDQNTAAGDAASSTDGGRTVPGLEAWYGYQKLWHTFALAGELYARYNFNTAYKQAKNAAGVYLTVINPINYGLSAHFGYRISPAIMAYALLGVEQGYFKTRAAPPYISASKTPFAFVPGIGFSAAISHSLSLRAQYSYSIYQKYTLTDNSGGKTTIRARQPVFLLGLSYHF